MFINAHCCNVNRKEVINKAGATLVPVFFFVIFCIPVRNGLVIQNTIMFQWAFKRSWLSAPASLLTVVYLTQFWIMSNCTYTLQCAHNGKVIICVLSVIFMLFVFLFLLCLWYFFQQINYKSNITISRSRLVNCFTQKSHHKTHC